MAQPVSFKMKDFGYKRIVRELKQLNDTHTDIGLWGQGSDPKNNMAYLGTIQEFGVPGRIPKRPFNRITFDLYKQEIKRFIAKMYGRVLDRRLKSKMFLIGLGNWYTKTLKKAVINLSWAMNAPSTLAGKDGILPLIDSGKMWNSIDHKEKL